MFSVHEIKIGWQSLCYFIVTPSHEWPSPIAMKFDPVVDLVVKLSLEAIFRVSLPKNWVKWRSEGSNFGFLKKVIRGHKWWQEWFRTYLKASKRSKIRERSARVKIISLRARLKNPRYRGRPWHVPYNAGFLNEHVEKRFWHEPNACDISVILVRFG